MKHFNMLCNGQKIRKKFEYKKKKTFERFSVYALLSKEESAALRTALLSVNAVIITANWLPLYHISASCIGILLLPPSIRPH